MKIARFTLILFFAAALLLCACAASPRGGPEGDFAHSLWGAPLNETLASEGLDPGAVKRLPRAKNAPIQKNVAIKANYAGFPCTATFIFLDDALAGGLYEFAPKEAARMDTYERLFARLSELHGKPTQYYLSTENDLTAEKLEAEEILAAIDESSARLIAFFQTKKSFYQLVMFVRTDLSGQAGTVIQLQAYPLERIAPPTEEP